MRTITRRGFLQEALLAASGAALARDAFGLTGESEPTAPEPDEVLASMETPVLPRGCWTDVRPTLSRLQRASGYSRITVHHAGGSDAVTETATNAVIYRIEGLLAGHVQQHYGDIAYHFVVDYAGRVWEGRSLRYVGAHVSGANRGNVGVLLLGNFEKQRASAAQLAAMMHLVGDLRVQYGMDARSVYGHRDLSASVCPGRYLYPHVARLRAGE